MKKFALALVAVAGVLLWARTGCSQDLTWSAVLKGVRTEYKDVRHISTDSLATLLTSSERTNGPIILDTRTRAEYDVSHIEGAIFVDPENPAIDSLGIDKDAPIVAYCSVGYRSSQVARALQDQGFSNVVNLEGSLFKWANEGRPVVSGEGQPTALVHPYNALWGRLLDGDVPRAMAPEEQDQR